jgi:hypothetical protein
MYDHKQLCLIRSWIALSREPERDSYARFISLWIAFNAACYARYSEKAQRNRADLRNEKGLADVAEGLIAASGELLKDGSKFKIDLKSPGRIVIQISERYIEEVIFDEFAREYQSDYENLHEEPTFEEAIRNFQEAIRKPNGKSYVINMARASQLDSSSYESLLGTSVIAALQDPKNLRQLKNVLYQVRCNVFHGEKVPGELNDDRITCAAVPVLNSLVEMLVPQPDT